MSTHDLYKYSITIHSDDLALVNCLRSLSQFSQKDSNNRIPWGGTKDMDWQKNNHTVTFRFTRPTYREAFVSEIERLLPDHLWSDVGKSDNDPAQPQR